MRQFPALSLLLLIVFLAAFLGGCAGRRAPVVDEAEFTPSPPPMSQPPAPATPGSLWTERQGSLFFDNKARDIGDIVTVAITESASASKQASTATGRDSSVSASISKFFGLEKSMSGIDPLSLVDTSYSNDFQGSGTTSRKENLVATLSTRVVEVLPNGNLRIAGKKTVAVNRENQVIVLTGIVRSSDISPQNVVDSRYVLDAKIAYTGNGVISDKQSPGWLTRILDNVWPF